MTYKVFSLIAIMFFVGLLAQAQEKLPSQSVFVELGGAGLPYSFNYDFRFDKNKMDSWGMRIGAGGYAFSGGDRFFSAPVQINKLFGKAPHYFEVGAGATLVAFKKESYSYCSDWEYSQTGEFICRSQFTSPSDETSFILDIKGSPNVMGTMSFGYRRIPVDGGFTWRANLTPIFNNYGFWPLFAGIGVGYAF